jgi:hypothetical protein
MKHLPLKELGYAIGAVLLVGAGYVGAYFALVVPDYELDRDTLRSTVRFDCVPKYRIGGASLRRVFDAVHRFDRKVRPETWESFELPKLRRKI